MKLSQIETNVWYPVTVPSCNKSTKFRPFTVREERALLVAQESEDSSVMLNTIESVVKNCVQNCPENITTFDAEYLFLIIRSKSVGEDAEVVLTCESCKKTNPQHVDITSAKVLNLKKNLNIKLSDKISLKMRYPSIGDITELGSVEENKDIAAIAATIETVFLGDEVFHTKDAERNDLIEFILNRTDKEMETIVKFIEDIPTVSLHHKYKCLHCETENEIKISGLSDFFA